MIFLVFYTTTHSMRGEDAAKRRGVPVTMIPTPRGVAGSCSLSLRFDGADPEGDGRTFFAGMTVPCTLFRQEGDALERLQDRGEHP